MILETLKQVFNELSKADLFYVFLAILLYFISVIIIGIRWKGLLSALHINAKLIDTSLATISAVFINNVTPASRISGEACRIFLIKKKTNADFIKVSASVLYDRLSELVPIIIIVILSFQSWYSLFLKVKGFWKIGIAILILGIVVYLIYRYIPKIKNKVNALIEQIKNSKITLKDFGIAVFFSILLWVQDVLRLIIIAYAFGIEFSIIKAATLSVVILIGGMVPTIGGLGAIEGGLVATLCFFGLSLDVAIAIAGVERFISYILSSVVGAIALTGFGSKKVWKAIRSHS